MIRLNGLKTDINVPERQLVAKIEKALNLKGIFGSNIPSFEYKILKKSLDARRKPELKEIYSLAITMDNKAEKKLLSRNKNGNVTLYEPVEYKIPNIAHDADELTKRVIITGSGPAGLFAAYLLAVRGYKPIILERGEDVDKRSVSVDALWKEGKLNPESNVQFGEGGAGTFSDGKLNTLVNDQMGRNQFVLNTFASFGADAEIVYSSKPHVGTDKLKKVVKNMRREIEARGGKFLFSCRLTDISYENGAVKSVSFENNSGEEYELDGRKICLGYNNLDTDILVLAIGHSARDTFTRLNELGIRLEQKNFAVGLRIQHPQSMINKSQYGSEYVSGLKAADYKLTNKASNGKGVYSFCMCPGGYVVNASSEEGRLCVNGMSYSGRDGENANSALIVTVDSSDFGSDNPLAGMEYQRRLEERAYMLGGGKIPTQLLADYKENRESSELKGVSVMAKGDYALSNLRQLFDENINLALIESIDKFGYTIKDYDRPDALLMGVESRTSSPVRILRDNSTLESVSVRGLYPCGEGAGYAGGITSAAMDGMKVAEKIIALFRPCY